MKLCNVNGRTMYVSGRSIWTSCFRNHLSPKIFMVVQNWYTKGNLTLSGTGDQVSTLWSIFICVWKTSNLYNISIGLLQGPWRFWCWIHTTHTTPFILCIWSRWKPALCKTWEANSIPRILSHVWILLWLRPSYFSSSANTKCTTTSSSLSRLKWWTNFPEDVSSCCLLTIIQYPSPVS